MLRQVRALLGGEQGNVAVIFSLAVVPLMLVAGAGVDMIRANNARTVVQAAADAAALAGGSSNNADPEAVKAVAEQYLAANGLADVLDEVKVVKINDNASSGKFRVSVEGKLKTSFMAIAGLSTMNIEATSEVKRGTSGPLELVLALDTTYSMIEKGKINALKVAARNLVEAVMTGGNVKAGVVPFADYFHVGLKYKGEPWLDVPPTKTETYESCTWTYPNKTGCTVQTTCYADGVPYSCNYETCTDWGTPVKSNCSVSSVTYKWEGCIAARPEDYHSRIDQAMAVPYPGRTWTCGAPMLDLTLSKAAVLDAIDALYPSGDTHIPSGLIWAWNMLTPQAPLKEASPMGEVLAKGGKKAVVLMTDGVNTSSNYADGNYGPHHLTSYGDGKYTDNLTATLCQKIKAEGTIIYTVLFDVTDSNIESLLRTCATRPDMSFVASDAGELLSAFGKIGTSLTKLRLTQ